MSLPGPAHPAISLTPGAGLEWLLHLISFLQLQISKTASSFILLGFLVNSESHSLTAEFLLRVASCQN